MDETQADNISALDEEVKAEENKENKSQAAKMAEMCLAYRLFHTPQQEPFATIPSGSHFETWSVKSKGFKSWLRREFYIRTKKVPNSKAVQDALSLIEGIALFDGPEIQVYTRVAEVDGAVWIDLGDKEWSAIMVTKNGWKIEPNPPVKFRRSAGMLSLPTPLSSADGIGDFRRFINVETEQDFYLIVAFLLSTFHPTGPFPLLVLNGEQGTAKSTTAKLIRSLVDPNEAPLRMRIKAVDDLMIAARNGRIVALDNLSYIPDWLSDALCCLSTGAALSKRQLYTDEDESILKAKRPVILTGIEELVVRGDLADRAIVVCLPVISHEKRKTEDEMVRQFNETAPTILGALLDGVVCALRNLSTIRLKQTPRMADFAKWITAADRQYGWDDGTMLSAYNNNLAQNNNSVLEASVVTPLLLPLASKKWEGTATDLLDVLDSKTDDAVKRKKGYPKDPRQLSGLLRRLAPNLRATGVDVVFAQTGGQGSKKTIVLRKMPKSSDASDAGVDSVDEKALFSIDELDEESSS